MDDVELDWVSADAAHGTLAAPPHRLHNRLAAGAPARRTAARKPPRVYYRPP